MLSCVCERAYSTNWGQKKTIALGMVVPDKEELPKQAFLASIPGHELTSKWYVNVLNTTCSNVMVEGLT